MQARSTNVSAHLQSHIKLMHESQCLVPACNVHHTYTGQHFNKGERMSHQILNVSERDNLRVKVACLGSFCQWAQRM